MAAKDWTIRRLARMSYLANIDLHGQCVMVVQSRMAMDVRRLDDIVLVDSGGCQHCTPKAGKAHANGSESLYVHYCD